MAQPYLIWLHPIPNLVALAGLVFIFATTDRPIILFGMGTLGLGVICFFIWSWHTKQWPFETQVEGGVHDKDERYLVSWRNITAI